MKNGFTLLETITVLLIALVLTTISIPNSYLLTETAFISSAAHHLASSLERASNLALRTGIDHTVLIERDSFQLMNQNGALLSNTQPYRHSAVFEGTPKLIIFRGAASATPASLLLRRGRSQCEVIISLRGRVRTTC